MFLFRFIEFDDGLSAKNAVAAMNNFELGGRKLKVSKCVVGGPLPAGMPQKTSVVAKRESEKAVMSSRVRDIANALSAHLSEDFFFNLTIFLFLVFLFNFSVFSLILPHSPHSLFFSSEIAISS